VTAVLIISSLLKHLASRKNYVQSVGIQFIAFHQSYLKRYVPFVEYISIIGWFLTLSSGHPMLLILPVNKNDTLESCTILPQQSSFKIKTSYINP
jgi:hypothetical protein